MNITHLIPHLDGDAGVFLLSWCDTARQSVPEEHHAIITLKPTRSVIHPGCAVTAADIGSQELSRAVEASDIVVIHWWNHPLLYHLMINIPPPSCRMAIYAHVNGIDAPQIISRRLLTYPDRFIISSPESYTAAALLERGPDIHLQCIPRTAPAGMIDAWHTLFTSLLSLPKRAHQWSDGSWCSGGQLFLESLGAAAVPFALSATSVAPDIHSAVTSVISSLGERYRTPTGGTPFHYRTYFADDPALQEWCRLLETTPDN